MFIAVTFGSGTKVGVGNGMDAEFDASTNDAAQVKITNVAAIPTISLTLSRCLLARTDEATRVARLSDCNSCEARFAGRCGRTGGAGFAGGIAESPRAFAIC